MISCFTEAELRQYAAGTLAAERRAGADEHLRACGACRQLAEQVRTAAASETEYSSALSGAPRRVELSTGSEGSLSGTLQSSDSSGPEMHDVAAGVSPPPVTLTLHEFLQNLSQSGLLPSQE